MPETFNFLRSYGDVILDDPDGSALRTSVPLLVRGQPVPAVEQGFRPGEGPVPAACDRGPATARRRSNMHQNPVTGEPAHQGDVTGTLIAFGGAQSPSRTIDCKPRCCRGNDAPFPPTEISRYGGEKTLPFSETPLLSRFSVSAGDDRSDCDCSD